MVRLKDLQEDFIGEQAIILNAKGKGLIVLSACAISLF
jgi:hypothetical protein